MSEIDQSSTGKSSARGAPGKRNARIGVIQVLYQMEITGRGASSVLDEFVETPPKDWREMSEGHDFDQRYLRQLVNEVVKAQAHIDACIRARLDGNWRLSRLDPTLRALLRAGTCEIVQMQDQVPGKVAMNEFIEVAKLFFDEKETGFVNAVLHGVLQDEKERLTRQLTGG